MFKDGLKINTDGFGHTHVHTLLYELYIDFEKSKRNRKKNEYTNIQLEREKTHECCLPHGLFEREFINFVEEKPNRRIERKRASRQTKIKKITLLYSLLKIVSLLVFLFPLNT